MQKPVTLIGIMGSGKTALARGLAERLKGIFIDSDHEIEIAAGRSIAEIFAESGEDFFREKETAILKRILDDHEAMNAPLFLATGGGAFINAQSRALLKARTHTIWLRADFELLWPRLEGKKNRPLLLKENPEQILQNLILARYPIYAEADMVIDCVDIDKYAMVDKVMAEDPYFIHFNGS